MIVVHKKSGNIIAKEARYAGTFFERLKGLMFIDRMEGFDALIIEPCNSIHNCFVRFPLDVVFLSRENKVVKVIRNFKPWRFSLIYPKANKVIELRAGELIQSLSVDDEVEVSDV